MAKNSCRARDTRAINTQVRSDPAAAIATPETKRARVPQMPLAAALFWGPNPIQALVIPDVIIADRHMAPLRAIGICCDSPAGSGKASLLLCQPSARLLLAGPEDCELLSSY